MPSHSDPSSDHPRSAAPATALITGSTAGIGAEFARQLASQNYDLVLVARSEDRLEAQAAELGERYEVGTSVIVADLATEDGVAAVQERLEDQRHPVHLLVNNAGYGLADNFLDNSLEEERALLRVLVQTPMELTHTAARAMADRRSGRIINVASVAAFTPTSTYSAAKAWLVNFSKAMHSQLKSEGITVTALCPGLVRTEFHERSGITISGAKKWMWLDADDVVRQGLTSSAQGSAVCVPSAQYRALAGGLRFIPDRVVQWAAEKRMGVPGQEDEPGRENQHDDARGPSTPENSQSKPAHD